MKPKPAIRNMNSKTRHKIKPVNKILDHCIHILPILIKSTMWTNEIFRRLQELRKRSLNYKFDTLDAIQHLQHGGLIEEIEDQRLGQKQLVRLTSLGTELANMIVSIDLYKNSHQEMLNMIRKHFELPKRISPNVRRSILRSRGWKNEDIHLYDDFSTSISWVMEGSGMIFKDGLFNRVINIVNDFSLSDIAKDIMYSLSMDSLSYQISVLLGTNEENYSYPNIGIMDSDQLFIFLRQMSKDLPNLMFNEVKNMLVSDLSILNPSSEEFLAEKLNCEKVAKKYGGSLSKAEKCMPASSI